MFIDVVLLQALWRSAHIEITGPIGTQPSQLMNDSNSQLTILQQKMLQRKVTIATFRNLGGLPTGGPYKQMPECPYQV